MSETVVETIALPAKISQLQLVELKTYVDSFLNDGQMVKFDASLLQSADGALLQFLLVFAKSHSAENPVILNANNVLLDALKDIGVSAEFMSGFIDGNAVECTA